MAEFVAVDAGGSFLALRLLADGNDPKNQDWVRFAKTSPVLTASAFAIP
jgi:hypothetical protein